MVRSRVKVSPKISSQRAGWMARVYSSVRSCRTLRSSTRQSVSSRLANTCQPGGAGTASAEAAGGTAGTADIAETPLLSQHVSGVVTEDLLQRGARVQRLLERAGRTERPD